MASRIPFSRVECAVETRFEPVVWDTPIERPLTVSSQEATGVRVNLKALAAIGILAFMYAKK